MIQSIRVEKGPPILCVLIPCFNESECIDYTVDTLLGLITKWRNASLIDDGSYLFFIDDGSTDDTWGKIKTHQSICPQVKGIRFTKNFGHQNAVLAGILENIDSCSISISIDCDLQQDPLVIPNFIHEYHNGSDIVFGVRNNRNTDSFLKKITAIGFYKLMRWMGADVIPNHADYRLLSNRAMKSLSLYSERSIFLRALCLKLGYKHSLIYFDVSERFAGTSKYTPLKMIKLAINGATSFSTFPLKLITMTGMAIFIGSIFMIIYVLFQALIFNSAIPGWASITLPIYFLGGIQLLCLAILGEYLAQTFSTVRKRPRYLIWEKI